MKSEWDTEWVQTFGVGSASLSLHSAQPSDEQRNKWALEDDLRSMRRIPLGFRASKAKPAKGKKGKK